MTFLNCNCKGNCRFFLDFHIWSSPIACINIPGHVIHIIYLVVTYERKSFVYFQERGFIYKKTANSQKKLNKQVNASVQNNFLPFFWQTSDSSPLG